MLLSLWKASLREWGSVWQCQKWHWLALYRRERVTWSTGSSPDLSDSDVRKWFSDLKGNLISSGKPLGRSISCIFLLLLITADRVILLRKVAHPELLRGHSLLVATPWLRALEQMQTHPSLSLERKVPWLMGVLGRWRVFAQDDIGFSPSISNTSGDTERGKDERQCYQCWKLRIFFPLLFRIC